MERPQSPKPRFLARAGDAITTELSTSPHNLLHVCAVLRYQIPVTHQVATQYVLSKLTATLPEI